MGLIRSLRRSTCVAFAFRFPACHTFQALPPLPPHSQHVHLSSPPPRVSNLTLRRSSTFTAPIPPTSKGISVYADIAFTPALPSNSPIRKNDTNSVYVINGTSRGIGLQFVKTLHATTQGTIVACCRNPSTASALNAYLESLSTIERSRIDVVQLDVEDQTSIESASQLIKGKYNRIDILINSAGILGDGINTPGPERAMNKIERDWMEKSMSVNCVGPLMLIKELSPLMKTKPIPRNTPADQQRPVSIIVNLSARVGSISDNGLGGWYSYRISKAALNQATRTLSHSLLHQGTYTIALHPGTTDTDLSKPFRKNVVKERMFPVDFTVEKLVDVIDNMGEENSGGLYDWAGKAVPF